MAVKTLAYDGRIFNGRVSKIYETVDPNTHRVTIRSEITDPKNDLRPGMLANFVIRVDGPVQATAIAANGVVREPDGTMSAWVTTDRRRFTERIIKTGQRKTVASRFWRFTAPRTGGERWGGISQQHARSTTERLDRMQLSVY